MYNLFYQLLSIIAPLITTPYITRILGSERIGVHSYYYSVAVYFSLFILLGLNNYGTRTIASCGNNKVEFSKNFINIYVFQLFCGAVVSILYLLYAMLFSDNSIVSLILYIYVFGAILDINWFFFGLELFRLTSLRNILIKFLSVLAIFTFVKTENDLYIYTLIISLSYMLNQLFLWTFLKKYVTFTKPHLAEIKKHIKPDLTLFLTVLLVSLFKIMDKIMLGIMSGYNEVGFYEASEKIIAIPLSIITALGVVMLPRSSNFASNNDVPGLKKYIKISIVFAMFISSSMCFGIMSVSKEFIPLFYGEGFDECVYIYIALLPSCIFLAFANVIRTQYLLPNKMDRSYIISAALGAVANIVVNLLLIPSMGAVGAAIGTFVAEAAVCVYQVCSVRKYLDTTSYISASIPFIVSGIIMFIILYFFIPDMMNMPVSLIIKVVCGILIYFSLLSAYSYIYKAAFGKNWYAIDVIKREIKERDDNNV